ncbi:unnamed protein product [Closterium sp. Yama58-4]|nr:unnamed protein product [Closterium sp. Yama58-4]
MVCRAESSNGSSSNNGRLGSLVIPAAPPFGSMGGESDRDAKLAQLNRVNSGNDSVARRVTEVEDTASVGAVSGLLQQQQSPPVLEVVRQLEAKMNEPSAVLESMKDMLTVEDLETLIAYLAQRGRDMWQALEVYDWMVRENRAQRSTRRLTLVIMDQRLGQLLQEACPTENILRLVVRMLELELLPDLPLKRMLAEHLWDRGDLPAVVRLLRILQESECFHGDGAGVSSGGGGGVADLAVRLRSQMDGSIKDVKDGRIESVAGQPKLPPRTLQGDTTRSDLSSVATSPSTVGGVVPSSPISATATSSAAETDRLAGGSAGGSAESSSGSWLLAEGPEERRDRLIRELRERVAVELAVAKGEGGAGGSVSGERAETQAGGSESVSAGADTADAVAETGEDLGGYLAERALARAQFREVLALPRLLREGGVEVSVVAYEAALIAAVREQELWTINVGDLQVMQYESAVGALSPLDCMLMELAQATLQHEAQQLVAWFDEHCARELARVQASVRDVQQDVIQKWAWLPHEQRAKLVQAATEREEQVARLLSEAQASVQQKMVAFWFAAQDADRAEAAMWHAAELAAEAGGDMAVDADVAASIAGLHGFQGNHTALRRLRHRMQQAGSPLDENAYTLMVAGAINGGHLDVAAASMQEMVERGMEPSGPQLSTLLRLLQRRDGLGAHSNNQSNSGGGSGGSGEADIEDAEGHGASVESYLCLCATLAAAGIVEPCLVYLYIDALRLCIIRML